MKTESERKIEQRSVMIVWQRDSWAVKYCTRKKHGRYLAAGFYAKDHSFSDVVKWVENQPNLRYEGHKMKTETKSADALARELAETAARRCAFVARSHVQFVHSEVMQEVILKDAKLRELCECAEALREIDLAFDENHDALFGRPVPSRLLEPIRKAKQALAALDGGAK